MFAQERNTAKVEKPLLFRVSYENTISYILGTNHALSSSVLPDECLEIINTCQSFVGEGTDPSIHQLEDFQTNFLSYFGRRANDVDWFQQLSIEQQILGQKHFDSFLETIYGPYSPKVAISEVRLSIVINFVQYSSRSLISNLFNEAAQSKEQSAHIDNEEQISGQMDLEICDLFDKSYGLEDHFNVMRLEADDECELEHLEDSLLLIQYLTSGQPIEWPSDDNKPNPLTDFAMTRENDEVDEDTENSKTQKRNKLFFANMLKHINELPAPVLVAVGAGHLIGKSGLLMQLDAHGIKVELYDPNQISDERFQMFEYCYKYYLQTLENIKNGLYFRLPKIGPNAPNNGVSSDLSNNTILELKKSRLYGCFLS